MKILVSGGAGYIGSHTVIQLVAAGHDVVIVDNFSNANPTVLGRMESLTGTALTLHSFDLCDYDKTEHLFAAEDFDAVIHFAGYKAVGESVEKPLDYYENNLGSTFSLVRAMQKNNVDKLVFSSSATVYGTELWIPMPVGPERFPRQRRQFQVIANDHYGGTSECRHGVELCP